MYNIPIVLRSAVGMTHVLRSGLVIKVRFGESLVVRLYSEIDHIHLSIEAQCVSHLLPLVSKTMALGFMYFLLFLVVAVL